MRLSIRIGGELLPRRERAPYASDRSSDRQFAPAGSSRLAPLGRDTLPRFANPDVLSSHCHTLAHLLGTAYAR